jgi:hypothetical protein
MLNQIVFFFITLISGSSDLKVKIWNQTSNRSIFGLETQKTD